MESSLKEKIDFILDAIEGIEDKLVAHYDELLSGTLLKTPFDGVILQNDYKFSYVDKYYLLLDGESMALTNVQEARIKDIYDRRNQNEYNTSEGIKEEKREKALIRVLSTLGWKK